MAKQRYYVDIFEIYKFDIRKTWKTIKTVIKKEINKSGIAQTFNINGSSISEPKIIADHFCDFFTNVGPTYAEQIPQSKHSSKHYLRLKKDEQPRSIFLSPSDPYEIIRILNCMKSKNSSSHDELSSRFLKSIGNSIAKPLSILVNKSMLSGVFPDKLKIAKVIPIYKNKEKCSVSNYRPISLLSSLSKILEKVMHNRLYSFFQSKDMFYKHQYGFRQKHNTIDAITKIIDDIAKSYDAKQSTLAVYCDLSKAFDTIDHNILLQKLNFYGIRGVALKWFKSYLSHRTQYVHYKGHNSCTKNIQCGVPQGSVLGPLLFIIYTNDLPGCLHRTKSILFADDTTIYLSSDTYNNMHIIMNQELLQLTDWFRANKLSLNVSKTNYMIFTYTHQEHNPMDIQLANTTLKKTSCAKFLGIHIDENLRWNVHIREVIKKLTRSFYAINKAKHLLNRKHLSTLYYSMVYPYLTYGITVWGTASKVHLSKLITKQKKIIRIIAGANYCAHTEPLFKRLNMLKFEDIQRLMSLNYVYKYIQGNLPSSLSEIFRLKQDHHNRDTRQSVAYKLHVSKPRTIIASQSIASVGPKLWNEIPYSMYIHNSILISRHTFTKRVKFKIIDKYVATVRRK